jgi:hypothetical protein
MDMKQIAEANYYICDVSSGMARKMSFNKEVVYDENGHPIIKETPVLGGGFNISRFHIVYSDGSLDPRTHVLNAAGAIGVDAANMQDYDAVKAFQKYLMEPSTIGQVYAWLHDPVNAPQGNGLMVIIINEEDHVRVFGHTICQFLSQCLGEDIDFIDAQMRPQLIPGYPKYQGNKAYAERLLRDQRDYSLLSNFTQMLSSFGSFSQQNIATFLDALNPPGLMHLYELLFPHEPLPPGNYTTDQVKKIIIGKSMERVPKQAMIPNLNTSNVYLDSLTDEIDRLNM